MDRTSLDDWQSVVGVTSIVTTAYRRNRGQDSDIRVSRPPLPTMQSRITNFRQISNPCRNDLRLVGNIGGWVGSMTCNTAIPFLFISHRYGKYINIDIRLINKYYEIKSEMSIKSLGPLIIIMFNRQRVDKREVI